MDDTAFIETSKEIMQELLNIAKSFYNMMVIVINVKKCNLIVINSSLPEEDNKVYLGNSADDSVSATKGDVRYLGVWIAGKKARNLNKQRIVGIRDVFLHSISRKSLSIAHMVYLVNKVLYPKIS
ncbi:unnamed protein product [Rhizophagus irregularis]|nr:unnamed protein product [Rhizophagus irregularis]